METLNKKFQIVPLAIIAALEDMIVSGAYAQPTVPAPPVETPREKRQALKLMQTIPLPGVVGRLDHMGVDL